VIDQGPDPGSGSLRFVTHSDYDTVMLFARATESYYIETTNLASGVDTVLNVLDKNGTETVLSSNDDCGSVRSCLTFVPTTSGLYRIRAMPTPRSAIGPGATYRIQITIQGDDYGDDLAGSAPLAADGVARTATFNSTTDADMFRLASSAAQTLSYRGCSMVNVPTRVQVLNSVGAVLDTFVNTSCTTPMRTFSVGAGVYFLKAQPDTTTTGSYQIQATLTADIDIDSTPTNAYTLTNNDSTGRVLGARFETATDEDWYKFTASAGGTFFMVETFGLDAGVDTELEIYAPSSTLFGRTGTPDSLPDTSGGKGLGQWMLRDDDGAISLKGSRLAFFVPVAGTYYVRARNKSGSSAGKYYLMFEDTAIQTSWSPYP